MQIDWKLLCVMSIIVVGGTLSSLKNDKSPAVTEAKEKSRFEAWPDEFKSNFVRECTAGVSEDKQRAYNIVCDCFAERLEEEHVLPTEYNPILSSASKFAQETSNRISQYFTTQDGTKTKEVCSARARDDD